MSSLTPNPSKRGKKMIKTPLNFVEGSFSIKFNKNKQKKAAVEFGPQVPFKDIFWSKLLHNQHTTIFYLKRS